MKRNKKELKEMNVFMIGKNNKNSTTKAVYMCTCVLTNSFMTSGSNPFGAKDVQTCDDVTVIHYVRLTFLCVLIGEK